MPKFSIIIPVYNVAPYLCECPDLVLAQTFVDWIAIHWYVWRGVGRGWFWYNSVLTVKKYAARG